MADGRSIDWIATDGCTGCGKEGAVVASRAFVAIITLSNEFFARLLSPSPDVMSSFEAVAT